MQVSESWVVYSYWSAASQRTEVSTLSLYEGMIDKYGLSPFNKVRTYSIRPCSINFPDQHVRSTCGGNVCMRASTPYLPCDRNARPQSLLAVHRRCLVVSRLVALCPSHPTLGVQQKWVSSEHEELLIAQYLTRNKHNMTSFEHIRSRNPTTISY